MSKKQSHLLPGFALTKHHVKLGKRHAGAPFPASHLFKMVLGSSEPTPPGHVSLWPQDSSHSDKLLCKLRGAVPLQPVHF